MVKPNFSVEYDFVDKPDMHYVENVKQNSEQAHRKPYAYI